MKFLLLEGRHRTGNVSYVKGDILESEHDLVASFVNKFKRLQDDAPATAKVIPPKQKTTAELEAEAKKRLEDPDNPANLIGATKEPAKGEKAPEKKEEKPPPKHYVDHRGGGRYCVCRTDNDEKVTNEWLTKEQAEEIANA